MCHLQTRAFVDTINKRIEDKIIRNNRDMSIFREVMNGADYSTAALKYGITAGRAQQVVLMFVRKLKDRVYKPGEHVPHYVYHLRKHADRWLSALDAYAVFANPYRTDNHIELLTESTTYHRKKIRNLNIFKRVASGESLLAISIDVDVSRARIGKIFWEQAKLIANSPIQMDRKVTQYTSLFAIRANADVWKAAADEWAKLHKLIKTEEVPDESFNNTKTSATYAA